jgi:hypothetical protein
VPSKNLSFAAHDHPRTTDYVVSDEVSAWLSDSGVDSLSDGEVDVDSLLEPDWLSSDDMDAELLPEVDEERSSEL